MPNFTDQMKRDAYAAAQEYQRRADQLWQDTVDDFAQHHNLTFAEAEFLMECGL